MRRVLEVAVEHVAPELPGGARKLVDGGDVVEVLVGQRHALVAIDLVGVSEQVRALCSDARLPDVDAWLASTLHTLSAPSERHALERDAEPAPPGRAMRGDAKQSPSASADGRRASLAEGE